MTTARHYDSWDLNTLREAHAYNQANPDPAFAGAEQWVAEQLAKAEAQRLHVTATPVADEEQARGQGGTGHTNYNAQAVSDAPTSGQVSFIRSLCEERGLDADAVLAGLTKSKASKEIDRLKAIKPQAVVRPATERQLAFLQDLLSEREHSFDGDLADLHFGKASNMIEQLLNAPRTGKSAHGIRHGRYAFQPADGSPAQFYRVAQNGRITVQAGPAEYPYNGKLNEALEAIKADPQAHAALYGQLIGSCGRCGLPLTDETSRAAGLGPVCSSKSDW